jgi:hypothetical protein
LQYCGTYAANANLSCLQHELQPKKMNVGRNIMLGNKIKNRILSVIFGLVIASAMIFSACDSVTNGNGGTADISELTALSVSSVKAGQTVITDEDGLRAIEDDPSGAYELGASFAVSNWTPICVPTSEGGVGPFTGTLDGAGYTITISSYDTTALTGSDYIGIFAVTQGASISNLTVNLAAGIVETNAHYVGGLVGRAISTQFNSITVTGDLAVVTPAANATPVNIGLVAGSGENFSPFGNTTIKANLKVLYNGPDVGAVNVGGIVGYLTSTSKLSTAHINGLFSVNADMPYTYSMDNGVRLGGGAGYADDNNGFYDITVDASTAVNADSTNNPVYVGGVLGKGNTVIIVGVNSDAFVTGNGPGYNTSAGGVAGYIVSSTVDNSSASGNIALSATWQSGSYNYWMVYAGGLVGYAGGSDTGNSNIDHSHATGAVSAESPYPYAGGLVGYLYGYNDFSGNPAEYVKFLASGGVTVAKNGGKLTSSYATGNVQATATANGLPYAGGLAGYSSIEAASGANIENSYARGNVIATSDGQYAWAGGLIGANAQGSIVENTYATGAVNVKTGINPLPYPQPGINPGAAGGGIAGVNYYVNASSGKAALVTHSVGLNAQIVGYSSDPNVAPYLLQRVAGDLGQNNTGILTENYGNEDMSILPVWNKAIGLNDLDGADTVAQPPQSFFTASPLSWDFNTIWDMGSDGYPALQ